MPPFLSGVIIKASLALGAAALLAFGAGFFVGQVRATYSDGFASGERSQALAQREAIDKIKTAAEKAAAAHAEAAERARIDGAALLAQAERRYQAALQEASRDPVFDACRAVPLPPGLRLPPGGASPGPDAGAAAGEPAG